ASLLFLAPPTPTPSALSLHDALPISARAAACASWPGSSSPAGTTRRRSCWPTWMPTASTRSRYTSLHELVAAPRFHLLMAGPDRSEEHTSELQSLTNLVCRLLLEKNK